MHLPIFLTASDLAFNAGCTGCVDMEQLATANVRLSPTKTDGVAGQQEAAVHVKQ